MEMDFDFDVPQKNETQRSRYNFDRIRPGASLHVVDDADRCRVMAAFKYWTKGDPNRRGAYATSAKVDDDDPKGPGFRIWFRSKREDAERFAAKVDMSPPHPTAAPQEEI